jgi:hypothetical protein
MKNEAEVQAEMKRLEGILAEKPGPSTDSTVVFLHAALKIELEARINMLKWVLWGIRQ